MSSSLNITSTSASKGIYITVKNEDELRIICNWCARSDHVFYDGPAVDAPEEDWLATAITHLLVNHPGVL